jgi:hypothetical protein
VEHERGDLVDHGGLLDSVRVEVIELSEASQVIVRRSLIWGIMKIMPK